jgi:thiazole synthase
MSDPLLIADRSFSSRLFLGTGKFPSNDALRGAIDASGTEMVTVALRRVDPTNPGGDILDAIPEGVLLLTNTSGAVDSPALPATRHGSSSRSPPTRAISCPTPSRP